MVVNSVVVRAAALPVNRLLQLQSRCVSNKSLNKRASGSGGVAATTTFSKVHAHCLYNRASVSEHLCSALVKRASFQLIGLLSRAHHQFWLQPRLHRPRKCQRTSSKVSCTMSQSGHTKKDDHIQLLAVSPSVVGPASGSLSEKLEAAGFHVHKLWEQDDADAFLSKHGVHCRALVPGHGADRGLMDRLPKLEIIANFGVGYDAIDVDIAKEKGVRVTNTPDVLTDDVADLALALLLDVSRRVTVGDRYVRDGKWGESNFPIQRKASEKTVGILGLGRIGEAIATRALAFKMEVAYHSRHEKSGVPYKYHASLVDLAKASDFLVIACPGGPSTHHIVNREVLDALGADGCLVNIARGSVVVEEELVKALVEGRLGSAGLDVFENEPEVPEELKKMDNVVLQPHVGSATFETRDAMANLVVANLKAHFDGKDLPTPVA